MSGGVDLGPVRMTLAASPPAGRPPLPLEWRTN